MAMNMPKILNCLASDCSYNKGNECHALAITIGDGSHAACDTFYRARFKGGVADMTGGVGACKVESCRFNSSLECTASGINVGTHQGHGDCTTFSPR